MNPFATHFLFLFVFLFACTPAARPWAPKVIRYCTCILVFLRVGGRRKKAMPPAPVVEGEAPLTGAGGARL